MNEEGEAIHDILIRRKKESYINPKMAERQCKFFYTRKYLETQMRMFPAESPTAIVFGMIGWNAHTVGVQQKG